MFVKLAERAGFTGVSETLASFTKMNICDIPVTGINLLASLTLWL